MHKCLCKIKFLDVELLSQRVYAFTSAMPLPNCPPEICINFNSYQQCKKVPISPHPCQQNVLVKFWLLPNWQKWLLSVVLSCFPTEQRSPVPLSSFSTQDTMNKNVSDANTVFTLSTDLSFLQNFFFILEWLKFCIFESNNFDVCGLKNAYKR